MRTRQIRTTTLVELLLLAFLVGVGTAWACGRVRVVLLLGPSAAPQSHPTAGDVGSQPVGGSRVFGLPESPPPSNRPPVYHVKATREGLVGRRTATGHIIQEKDLFVALPSRYALHKKVKVTYGNVSVVVPVRDVGPWSTNDPYWATGTRPLAESGRRVRLYPCDTANGAGIDLSDGVWYALGIPRGVGIVDVSWEFVD